MKALDIQLEVSKRLVAIDNEVRKQRNNLANLGTDIEFDDLLSRWKEAHEIAGAYYAYNQVYEMLLDCDEINEQLEAEANAEEEEN